MPSVCVIVLDGWTAWWDRISTDDYLAYVSLIIVILAFMVSKPLAQILFFLIRRLTPSKWIWPDDAKELMLWETKLLIRFGLLWSALAVAQLTQFFCQWPLWIFGIPLLIWLTALLNIIQRLIVRIGMRGRTEKEHFTRKTLLQEGSSTAKKFILFITFYLIYFGVFSAFSGQLVGFLFVGFCVAIALSLVPMVRNMVGVQYVLFGGLFNSGSQVYIHGNPPGQIVDGTLEYVCLKTDDGAKTYIPAGMTMSTTIAHTNVGHFPVRLTVKLPNNTAVARVRTFIQQLDYLMRHSHNIFGMHPSSDCEINELRNSETTSFNLIKRFQVFQTDERMELPDNKGFVAVDGKWILRIYGSTRSFSVQQHRETVSKIIQSITNLMEESNLSNCGRVVPY